MMRTSRVAYALLLCAFAARQVAAAALQTQSCKTFHASGDVPATSSGGPIMSMIVVDDNVDLASVAVRNMTLDGGKFAGIKISLSAGTPHGGKINTVVLKDLQHGASTGQTTFSLEGASFDDDAAKPVPEAVTAAPITGSYIPQQMLLGLATGNGAGAGLGGSNGTWLLRVVDLNIPPQPLHLKSWTLELCPLPRVAATEGDPDGDNDVHESAASAHNATAATNTTKQHKSGRGGLVQELLERIDTAVARNPLLAGRTTSLRAAINNNATLYERVNTRIQEMLKPFNETRVVRMINSRSEPAADGNVTTNTSSSPWFGTRARLNRANTTTGGLWRSIVNAPDAAAAADASADNTTTRLGLFRRRSTSGPVLSLLPNGTLFRSSLRTSAAADGAAGSDDPAFDGALANFLDAFRSLVTLAGGPNATHTIGSNASNGSVWRSSIMQQSGGGLLDGGSMLSGFSMKDMMNRVGNGQLLSSMVGSNRLLNAANDASAFLANKLTSGPLSKAANGMLSSAASDMTSRYRDALATLSSAGGVVKDFRESNQKEQLAFLDSSRKLVQEHLAKQVQQYRDLITACAALVQSALQKNSEASAKSSAAMMASVRSSLDNLNLLGLKGMKMSPELGNLQGLLTKQLANLQGLNLQSKALGSNFGPVVASMFEAYKAQTDALKEAAQTAINNRKSKAQQQIEAATALVESLTGKLSDRPWVQKFQQQLASLSSSWGNLGGSLGLSGAPRLIKFDDLAKPAEAAAPGPFRQWLASVTPAAGGSKAAPSSASPSLIPVPSFLNGIGNGKLLARFQEAVGSSVNGVSTMTLMDSMNRFRDNFQKSFGQ